MKATYDPDDDIDLTPLKEAMEDIKDLRQARQDGLITSKELEETKDYKLDFAIWKVFHKEE